MSTNLGGMAGTRGGADAEYEVLRDLLVPSARDEFFGVLHDWDSTDTKALGVLAVDAAAIAVLVATHDVINQLWWVAAIGCAIGGAFLIASIWPRTVQLGPDLVDAHENLSESSPLDVAREMLTYFTSATEANDETGGNKVFLFFVGLAGVAISLVGSIPLALLRP